MTYFSCTCANDALATRLTVARDAQRIHRRHVRVHSPLSLRIILLVISCTCVINAQDAKQRANDARALLARTPSPPMHIVLGDPLIVDVRLHTDVVAPHALAKRWQFVVAGPVVGDGQRIISVSLVPNGKRSADLSAWKRPLLIAEVATNQAQPTRMSATWQAQIELRSRTLVDGPSDNPVAVLPMAQRSAALADTPMIDWTSEAFQKGLDTADLRPHEGEHAIAFAQRVLRHVRSLSYRYTAEMNRCASHVLSSGTSDCGGLGGLAVATLRAAGIPARLLVGRWAKTAKPTDQLEGLPYGQWHVKLEFYVDGVGWIPADAAIEMNDPTAWFGKQNADFITLHVDPGVRVKTLFGERELLLAQGMAFWIRGDGTLDDKTVEETWTVTPVR